MHIPSCSTQSLPVVPFDAALTQALEPSPDYDITKWIYVPNHYGEYRYILAPGGSIPSSAWASTLYRRPGRFGQQP